MSWTSPLTVASTTVALAALVGLLHVGLEVRHGRLHGLGRLEHEGQLHLARGEELAHRLHAGQEEVVDDGEGRVAAFQGLGQVVLEPVAVAVDDALLEAALDGPSRAVLGDGRGGGHAFEDRQQLLQRVVPLAAAVVDQVQAHLAGPFVDLRQRDDPRRVDDGGVEPGSDALVEEHRVEDVARRGVEPERDVGQPDDGEDPGQLRLDAA